MTTSTQQPEIVSIVSFKEDHIDSDHIWVADLTYSVYVEVWDGEKVSVRAAVSHGTRAECEAVKVNASPETLAAAVAYKHEDARRRYAHTKLDQLMRDARSIGKGTRVRVVRGRNVAKGTEGVVFWTQDEGFQRCGFNTDSGETVWTYLRNVEAIVDDIDFPTLAELREEYK